MSEPIEALEPRADDPVRHDMVRWYEPRLLLRTGLRAASATLIGEIADYREVQAALDPIGEDPLYGATDYGNAPEHGDFWIDYVSDLGDGWHATCSVARALAGDVPVPDGGPLKRGDILIMGGDEVYPEPSTQAYEERLIGPYVEACRNATPFRADVFALPGNHDWYDGLKAFTSVFCMERRYRPETTGRRIGYWSTRQSRSYFALRLPRGWWLCGVDIQLGSDLNPTQVDYFTQIARHAMQPGDRIIVCTAEPSWVFARTRRPAAAEDFRAIVDILESGGADVKLALSGDLHHYSRYAPKEGGPTFITSGGGGAFMHPTHKLPDEMHMPDGDGTQRAYRLAWAYPGKVLSRALTYRNLLFPFINWDFSAAVGLVYAFLAWFLESRRLGGEPLSDTFLAMMAGDTSLWEALGRFFETIPRSPEFAIVVLAVYAGLMAFNRGHRRLVAFTLGTLHTATHFAALIAAFCASVAIADWAYPQFDQIGGSFFLFLGLMTLIGGLLGGIVFGAYLIVGLNFFGLQWTNCFSALRIADYKNFVRLRIDADGALHVHPIKIEQASRTLPTGRDTLPSRPEPIEDPIVIE